MIFTRSLELVNCGKSKNLYLPENISIQIEGLANCIKISCQARVNYTIYAFARTHRNKKGLLVYSSLHSVRCDLEEFGEFFPKRYDVEPFLEEVKRSCPQFFEWMIWNLL